MKAKARNPSNHSYILQAVKMILLLRRKPHILIGSRQFKKILQHVQSAGGLSVSKSSSKGKLILQDVRDHPKSEQNPKQVDGIRGTPKVDL